MSETTPLQQQLNQGLSALAARLLNEADAAIDAGRLVQARSLFVRAVELDRGVGSRNAYACFLLETGSHREAVDLLEVALSRAQRDGDLRTVAIAASNLACAYRGIGAPAMAMAWQQQALKAAHSTGEPAPAEADFAADLQNRANDALIQGDYELARTLFCLAGSTFQANGDECTRADNWGGLGVLAGLCGDLSEAVRCLREAYRKHRDLPGCEMQSVGDLLNLAEIRRLEGSWRTAERLLKLAMRRLGKQGDAGIVQQVRTRLAEARQAGSVLGHDPQRN